MLLKFGDFPNKNTAITVYDPKKPNHYDDASIDDYDNDNNIDTRLFVAAGLGAMVGAVFVGGSLGGGFERGGNH